MNREQILAKRKTLLTLITSGLSLNHVERIGDHYTVDYYVALPVLAASAAFNREEDIEVFDDGNNLLGVLCFTKSYYSHAISSLSAPRFVAYLHDVELDAVGAADHVFKSDYFLVLRKKYSIYTAKMMKTSAIWGAFIHTTEENSPYNTKSPRA